MKGQGSVYKQPKSRNWWLDYHANGKRHRESAKTENKTEAQKLLRQRLADADRGEVVDPKNRKLTVDDLLDDLEVDYENNGKRVDSLRYQVKAVRDLLGKVKACDLDERALERAKKRWLDDEAAPGTVNNRLAYLRAAFNVAKKRRLVERVPHFDLLRLDNVRRGFFKEEQHQAILAELSDDLRPFAAFLWSTGWRAGEAQELQWKNVDLERGTIRLDVGTTKNREGRVFPISADPDLRELLEEQRRRTDEVERTRGRIVSWVFHRGGKPIKSYKSGWDEACKRAGYPGRLVHDYRRTRVRRFEDAGVPRSVAMALTGHKTEAVYRRYAIVDEADLASWLEHTVEHERQQRQERRA